MSTPIQYRPCAHTITQLMAHPSPLLTILNYSTQFARLMSYALLRRGESYGVELERSQRDVALLYVHFVSIILLYIILYLCAWLGLGTAA